MTSYTSPNGLPYPDDYAASADVPTVIGALAAKSQDALNLKANLTSPGLVGEPTAPTAPVDTNSAQIANTAFVKTQIANDAPTKGGGGASGTWPINVTGSASSASSGAAGGAVIRLTATPASRKRRLGREIVTR